VFGRGANKCSGEQVFGSNEGRSQGANRCSGRLRARGRAKGGEEGKRGFFGTSRRMGGVPIQSLLHDSHLDLSETAMGCHRLALSDSSTPAKMPSYASSTSVASRTNATFSRLASYP